MTTSFPTRLIIIALASIVILQSCHRAVKPSANNFDAITALRTDTLPIISLHQDSIQLGQIVKGTKIPMVFTFTNTGSTDLMIEIVTTCKCTEIDWPRTPIPPGQEGKISAIYDTSNEKVGSVRKTLDIVANTDPLLIEASFFADIIEQ